jgi:hypothetical protein
MRKTGNQERMSSIPEFLIVALPVPFALSPEGFPLAGYFAFSRRSLWR